MWTYCGTAVALDTFNRVPVRYIHGNTSLLVLGGSSRECSILVALECTYRKVVALLREHRLHNFLYEFRDIALILFLLDYNIFPLFRYLKLDYICTLVNCSKVHAYNVIAFLAVGLLDEELHLLHSQVVRDNLRDLEECGLEDSVGPVSKAYLLCNLGGIDDIHVDIVLCQIFLNMVRKVLLGLLRIPDRVVEECATLLKTAQTVVFVKV